METVLAMVDKLANQLVNVAAPVNFHITQEPTTLTEVRNLRCQVAIEREWATPNECPTDFEQDSYDDQAVHIIGLLNNQPVAAARLVFPRPGQRLPTEEKFDLDIEPRRHVVDISWALVLAEYSDTQHRVASGLLARCWLELRTHGYFQVCAYATPTVIRLYRSAGLQFIKLGYPRRFWGEDYFPISLDIMASSRLWQHSGEPAESHSKKLF